MNLISCDGCGVVLNKDVLEFPIILDESGEVISENCLWSGDKFVPFVRCPVCSNIILQTN